MENYMKKTTLVAISVVIIGLCGSLYLFIPSKESTIEKNAKEIQETANKNLAPGQSPMPYEVAKELAKRFYEHDVEKKPDSRSSIDNSTKSIMDSDWESKNQIIKNIINELATQRRIIFSEIGVSDDKRFSLDGLTENISIRKSNGEPAKAALANLTTELINDLVDKVGKWKTKHPKGLSTKAKDSIRIIMKIENDIKNL